MDLIIDGEKRRFDSRPSIGIILNNPLEVLITKKIFEKSSSVNSARIINNRNANCCVLYNHGLLSYYNLNREPSCGVLLTFSNFLLNHQEIIS